MVKSDVEEVSSPLEWRLQLMSLGGTKRTRAVTEVVPSQAGPNLSEKCKNPGPKEVALFDALSSKVEPCPCQAYLGKLGSDKPQL